MSKNKKSFSPQFERDYLFYLSNKDKFTFAGINIKNDYGVQFPGEAEPIYKDENGNDEVVLFSIPYSVTGKSAKVCFFFLDSEGKNKPCSEPQLLIEILNCKAAVNMQIKMWAESRAECTLPLFELKEYLEYYSAPEWVFKAVENQKLKIIKTWVPEKQFKSDFYKKIAADHIKEFIE